MRLLGRFKSYYGKAVLYQRPKPTLRGVFRERRKCREHFQLYRGFRQEEQPAVWQPQHSLHRWRRCVRRACFLRLRQIYPNRHNLLHFFSAFSLAQLVCPRLKNCIIPQYSRFLPYIIYTLNYKVNSYFLQNNITILFYLTQLKKSIKKLIKFKNKCLDF